VNDSFLINTPISVSKNIINKIREKSIFLEDNKYSENFFKTNWSFFHYYQVGGQNPPREKIMKRFDFLGFSYLLKKREHDRTHLGNDDVGVNSLLAT
jgi:hypothetical protein